MLPVSDPPILDNETRDDEAPSSSSGHVSLDRSASFLLVFGAIMLFLSFYLATVQFVGEHLQLRFAQIVSESIRFAPGTTLRYEPSFILRGLEQLHIEVVRS